MTTRAPVGLLHEVRARIIGEVVLACAQDRARPSFRDLLCALAQYPTVTFVEAIHQLVEEDVLAEGDDGVVRLYSLTDHAVRGCSYDR